MVTERDDIVASRHDRINSADDDRADLLWAWRTAIDNNESHGRSVAACLSIAGEICKSPDLVATLLRSRASAVSGIVCPVLDRHLWDRAPALRC